MSVPLRKLGNYFVRARRGVSRRKAFTEAHHVAGDEAMPRIFVEVFHRSFHLCSLVSF